MKDLSLKMVLSVLVCLLGGFAAFAQKNITVTVQDEMGPIPGANVQVKGTTVGQITDLDGVAHINGVTPDNVLVISFIGYQTSEVTVGTNNELTVTLAVDSEVIEETVVVGYGVQKKASLTSAISSINSEDIVATKQSDVVSSLQGKIAGLQIKQNAGNVGFFDNDLNLRGFGEPLVIIDGVARQGYRKSSTYGATFGNSESGAAALAALNPEDIESITVLKDASASIYGIGAQNGVILVTTKKGTVGKPSVSYSNTLSFGFPTALPDQVSVVDYMNAENEMLVNSRKSAKFSEELISKYRNHEKGYEGFDWQDAVLKKHNFNQVHNLSIRGGSESTRYYLSANLTDQNNLFRSKNGSYDRYGFTGNVTSYLTKNLSVTFQSAMTITNQVNPNGNAMASVWFYILNADRTLGATTLADPTHYTDLSISEHRNPVALYDPEIGGYKKDNTFTFRNNLDLKYEAPFLQGLTLSAAGAVDFVNRKTLDLSKKFPLYDYYTDELTAYNNDSNQYGETWNNFIKYYAKLQANYDHTFNDVHHVGATFAAEMTVDHNSNLAGTRQYNDFYTHDIINQGVSSTQTNSGTRTSSATAGYIGRLNYDYKGKYLVELMARYDGTYLYAPGHRWGFFPSYSLGWRVSDETFFKNLFPWINNLKVRWSDGKTGMAQGSAYGYLLGYSANNSSVFTDGTAITGYASHSTAQTLISWADVRMKDIGVDFEAWRGKLGINVDWFWRDVTGKAAQPSSSVPDFYGLSLPQMNLNASQNVGIDLTISHRNTIGKFNYRVAFNASLSRNRNTKVLAEDTKIWTSSMDYYKNNTRGRWSNALSSSTYHWLDGTQFGSWSEIVNSPVMYGLKTSQSDMLPGMYRIEDRNGDGFISDADVFYSWSETNPPLQLGLVLSGSYKNFDFNLNFNGATLTNKVVCLSGGMGFGYFNTFFSNYMDHWRLADGYTDPFDPESKWVSGYWPAIAKATSAQDQASNASYRYNQPYSYVDGTFVRLKSLELGYTLPAKYAKMIHLRSVRVYFNGTNLLTFCNKLLKPYDPERNQGANQGIAGQPLMKTYSVGVNINF